VGEGLWDLFGTVVVSVERLGIDVVVDECCEDGAGNGGGVPTCRIKNKRGDFLACLRHLGCVL
jgi:hypothetical protein